MPAQIIPADLDDPRVAALLRRHLEIMASHSGGIVSMHALDLAALRAPDIRVWAACDADDLAGIAALRRLSLDHGEVKSMHTAEARRRGGIGGALLRHIIAAARVDGMTRLSLETGARAFYRPAVALYTRHGFVPCPPFGDYRPDPNSIFMTIDLRGERPVRA